MDGKGMTLEMTQRRHWNEMGTVCHGDNIRMTVMKTCDPHVIPVSSPSSPCHPQMDYNSCAHSLLASLLIFLINFYLGLLDRNIKYYLLKFSTLALLCIFPISILLVSILIDYYNLVFMKFKY